MKKSYITSPKKLQFYLPLIVLLSFPATSFSGPFDNVQPYDLVEVLTVVTSIFAYILLLVLDLICWLILRISKKKWKLKTWGILNASYLVLAPLLLYSFFYWGAYNSDGARRDAFQAGKTLIAKHRLESAYLNDKHFYYDKSQLRGNVILVHNFTPLPDSLRIKIDSIPNLMAVHKDDSVWYNYYK